MRITFIISFILFSLTCMGQSRYDVIVDEIMADPNPPSGLPAVEWIELRNVSSHAIDLKDWRIEDRGSQSGPCASFLLLPDSCCIVCPVSAASALSIYGSVLPLSGFPSLDNEGDQLSLRSADGSVIFGIDYSVQWHSSAVKRDGGWSLEMVDTDLPCMRMGNWGSSVDPSGGTPGRINSINGRSVDDTGPSLRNAFMVDSSSIQLSFDEAVDSGDVRNPGNFAINERTILSAAAVSPLFDGVALRLDLPLEARKTYLVEVQHLRDCAGNEIGNDNSIYIGVPEQPVSGSVVVNEILFNPAPDGYDFIEIVNRGGAIINASQLFLANRSSAGAIGTATPLSNTPYYIFPGDLVVATEDPANLAMHFLVANPERILAIDGMPAYSDDAGSVILLGAQGEILDEVDYSKNWHFKLLKDEEGISLERIDPDGPSNLSSNWHSASQSVGYGTPTTRNSQAVPTSTGIETISISPPRVSPDNDGFEDQLVIRYRVNEAGWVGSVRIFDAAGRIVRVLINNQLMGVSGYWVWDGLNDHDMRLGAGNYIVLTELFNLAGRILRDKKLVTLAVRFK